MQPSAPSGPTVDGSAGVLDAGPEPPVLAWQASWIGRHTPAVARVVREIESDHVAWVEPGHWLGQTVSIAGPATAVSVDITGDRAVADLELCTPSGDVLAARTLVGGDVPWDRFSQFLQVDPPLPADTYLVRLTARQGQVGWRSRFAAAPDRADDGVSPLPVVGSALRGRPLPAGPHSRSDRSSTIGSDGHGSPTAPSAATSPCTGTTRTAAGGPT